MVIFLYSSDRLDSVPQLTQPISSGMTMKHLHSISIFIFALAILNWSITHSNASLSGPNISMGNNPIENFYGVERMYVNSSITLVSTNSTMDFMVTKAEVSSVRCTLAIDGNTVFSHYSTPLGVDYLPSSSSIFEGHLRVPSGSILTLDSTLNNGDVDCAYYVEGYYAHP